MRRLSSAVVAATIIFSMLQGGATAAHAGTAAFYLALGDSVAAGHQPGRGDTHKGYVDDLWHSVERQQIPGLRLRNVACSGETSRSLITGIHSPCPDPAGSQLERAVAFLQGHPGQVTFITIDIGGNDLLKRCMDWSVGLIDRSCVVGMMPKLELRLSRILNALGTAGPGVPIVGMNYYDPFLGLWGLLHPGGRALAHADLRAWTVFNDGLETAYADAGVTVADVAATFRIDDFTPTVLEPGRGRIPVNVALTCRWTWFCSPKSPTDVHPNQTGYRKIARTFNREVKRLLP